MNDRFFIIRPLWCMINGLRVLSTVGPMRVSYYVLRQRHAKKIVNSRGFLFIQSEPLSANPALARGSGVSLFRFGRGIVNLGTSLLEFAVVYASSHRRLFADFVPAGGILQQANNESFLHLSTGFISALSAGQELELQICALLINTNTTHRLFPERRTPQRSALRGHATRGVYLLYLRGPK